MGRVPKKPAVVLTPGSKRPGNSKTDRYKSSSDQSSGGKKSSSGKSSSGKKSSVASSGGKSSSGTSGSGKRSNSSRKISGGGGDSSFRGKRKKASSRKDNYRTKYRKEDMERAVRLVKEKGWSVAAAARKAEVPRMTLSDRLKHYDDPIELPQVGRPQELSKAEEEAIVNCLVLCAEFQYPMNKKDLQNFVQAYVVENNIQTRWPDGRPGKDWVRSFTKRWRHQWWALKR
jgi:transposase-like protein